MEFLGHFPFQAIRPQQTQVLQVLEDAWNDYDYFILEVPTGGGKSAIAKALGGGVNSSFLLTATKQLQDQYIRDFAEPDIVSLKGRVNYACAKLPRLTVENGLCTGNPGMVNQCRKNDICHYYRQRDKALANPIALTSYPYFFYSTFCGDFWEARDLVIYDEAHLIESQLVDWASITVRPEQLWKEWQIRLPAHTWQQGYSANRDILIGMLKQMDSKKKTLYGQMMDGTLEDAADAMDIEDLMTAHHGYYSLDKARKQFDIFFGDPDKRHWLIVPLPNNEGLTLTPLTVGSLFNRLIARWGQKHVFMSATILDTDAFEEELQLPEGRTAVLRVDSEFPPNHSPIRFWPAGPMTHDALPDTIPKIITRVEEILALHPEEKGIIHTGTYAIGEALMAEIANDRLLFRTEKETNGELLARHHAAQAPTVIVSPSLTTGADLVDDLSRFQIIVKLPWGNLTDPRIGMKAKLNRRWYQAEMMRAFVQAAGRSTRSAEDWSITYVLDSKFRYWIDQMRKYLPNQFLRRIRWHYTGKQSKKQ